MGLIGDCAAVAGRFRSVTGLKDYCYVVHGLCTQILNTITVASLAAVYVRIWLFSNLFLRACVVVICSQLASTPRDHFSTVFAVQVGQVGVAHDWDCLEEFG
jgi:hypothetical protein